MQQINLLEEGIGFRLYNRSHRGISLTPSGETFLEAAKKILQIYENACEKGISLEKARDLYLRISYPHEQFPAFLLLAYEAFRSQNPNALVEFVPIAFNEHFSAVSNGIADLSVIAEPHESYLEELEFFPLSNETYSFCMCPDHPLASVPMITMDLLFGVKIICGSYDYLKTPFVKQLSPSNAILKPIGKEYDMSIRTERLMSNKIMVIHSLWSNPYESFLKVIPSNISAGRVGVIYSILHSSSVMRFLPFLKKIQNI